MGYPSFDSGHFIPENNYQFLHEYEMIIILCVKKEIKILEFFSFDTEDKKQYEMVIILSQKNN